MSVACRSLVVLVVVVVGSGTAYAGPDAPASQPAITPAAKAHLDRGLRLYNAHKYADAIAEFQAGYQIDPAPEFLYAIGQAERLNGDCEHAISAFEAYLRTQPNARRASSAKEKLAWCRDRIAQPKHTEPVAPPAAAPEPLAAPAPAAPPAPSVAITAAAAPDVAAPHDEPSRPRRRWAWRAVAATAVLAAGGTALGLYARSRFDQYRRDPLDNSFSAVSTSAAAADILFAGAGIAAVSATVLFSIGDPAADRAGHPGGSVVGIAATARF